MNPRLAALFAGDAASDCAAGGPNSKCGAKEVDRGVGREPCNLAAGRWRLLWGRLSCGVVTAFRMLLHL